MINAVLLDLDNTLVLFDEAVYVDRYFDRLAPRFSDLFPDQELRRRVVGATAALLENKGGDSNRAFFLSRFCSGAGIEPEEAWERFVRFYEEDYPSIRVAAAAAPGLAAVLERLGRSRLKLALASNPVFPKIAQEARMAWAGIAENHFDLFTHIENMSFVKPDTGYYRQICDMLREPPAACLMVGNDRVGDMAAKLAGLKTYRTTDAEAAGIATVSLTDRIGARPLPDPDFTGPLSGLLSVVEEASGACDEARTSRLPA